MAVIGALSFILLVTAGARVLSSCASTPDGLKREQGLYLVTSNALTGISSIAPYVPPPIGTLIEGITAVGGALLAVWASHLHRSVRALETRPPPGTAQASSGAKPPATV
jgi:hypothetical protein